MDRSRYHEPDGLQTGPMMSFDEWAGLARVAVATARQTKDASLLLVAAKIYRALDQSITAQAHEAEAEAMKSSS